MTSYPVLTSLIFFPLAMALVLFLVRCDRAVRWLTLGAGFVEMFLALPLLGFQLGTGEMQFVEQVPWVARWNLQYYLAVDGISLFMVVLTVALLPLCTLCSWTYISKRAKEFHVCLLMLTGACVGVFVAMDFVLFYVFWEAMLIPMYLLIAVWGGPRRRYASIKFFLYTMAGSTLLLVAIVAFYHQAGTFSIPDLMKTQYSFHFQFWAFLAMALAFAIKCPMFPFHTWLPAAHVEAPAAGSVYLASVLLKMGAYGFLRFCLPLTPAASDYFAPMMIAISLASIIYGGLAALGQHDMKKLIAYSSVGHMGFVTLGIFLFNSRGVEGAMLQMLNHGITTGALFMLVGAIYERSHSREISDNLGLGKFLPIYMFFFGLFTLSSFGFPGTNSFVGETLVLIGAFSSSYWVGAIAIPGALIAAAYMLRLGLKLAWGQPSSVPQGHFWDLNMREWLYLAPLAVFVLYIGLAPGIFLKVLDPSIDRLLEDFHARSGEMYSESTSLQDRVAPELAQLVASDEGELR
ncbi:complex I subunit 4 family protein [Desulfobaculum bizertense]|uniref:NADH-quinone oxidoreductase subunit M n=1 Tax=Desulfobaculum bizertense DSM 18034 TaxID=1121442 RepID=A0A1T4VWH3_9BACT|nr:NADH-quinone oxidoreductase subunit M [Desulfobaculum bizertense]UIJ36811.1 NADH-quinone oxidoreductase subunit M [Desulfobaculum bizertense]SKA69353.1 NADH-quinone oxidoreductase subunit M [Desulfobaculum bizertense DSM 18034]